MKVPNDFPLKTHWEDPLDGMSDEPDMTDEVEHHIKKLNSAPYERRCFNYLNGPYVLRTTRKDLPRGTISLVLYLLF